MSVWSSSCENAYLAGFPKIRSKTTQSFDFLRTFAFQDGRRLVRLVAEIGLGSLNLGHGPTRRGGILFFERLPAYPPILFFVQSSEHIWNLLDILWKCLQNTLTTGISLWFTQILVKLREKFVWTQIPAKFVKNQNVHGSCEITRKNSEKL